MSGSGEKFAQFLTEAVYRIRSLESKNIRIVQDELGYAIGKNGGSSVEHWRKGNLPSRYGDVEQLAREIIKRTDLDIRWLQPFLSSADYPYVDRLCAELFPPAKETNGSRADAKPKREELTPVESETVIRPLTFAYNLPPQPTLFVGRERELAEITRYLGDPACRLLTLTGPGGIGKTRLAIQSAQNAVELPELGPQTFPHGVYFVSLAPLSSIDFLVATLADALQFTFFSGEDLEEQLLSFLRQKQLLLVVDNLEHLMQAAGLLAKILLHAPSVKIMTTSRERLSLRGEWVMEIQGMTFPRVQNRVVPVPQSLSDTSMVLREETAVSYGWETYGAVQLFMQSAKRIVSDFVPTEKEIMPIVQICQLVEGIPLAIELAASWVHVLSCEEIVSEIQATYEFLATTWRDMPERHRSLQAVFNYSWELVSDKERDVIRKLSVFRGGFRREAAAQVADATLMTLSGLVDKSFLYRKSGGTDNTAVRYEMHDLLRQYAEEKLNADPAEKEATLDRHCRYFADFVNRREANLTGGKQTQTLEEMGEEIENIRAALRQALNGRREELEKFIEPLFLFYEIRSWSQEGEETFRLLAQEFQREQQLEPSEKTEILWAKTTARRGTFDHRLGFYPKAGDLLQESLTVFQRYEIHAEIAFALNQLGYVAYRLGDHAEAQKRTEESLELSQRMGNRRHVAESLRNLAEIAELRGKYEEAKQFSQQSLQISQELDNRRGAAASINHLGYLAWRLGQYKEAEELCLESLTLCQELGDRRGIAMSYKNLGNIACDTGQFQEARQNYLKGLRISEEIGYKWGIAAFLNNLGNVALELKEYTLGKELCQKCLSTWREMGYQFGMANTLDTLGYLAEGLGQDHEAKGYFIEALILAIDMEATPMALHVFTGLAFLLGKAGNAYRAVEILTFVLNHPMAGEESRARSRQFLPSLWVQLGEAQQAEVVSRAQQDTFEGITQELLTIATPA